MFNIHYNAAGEIVSYQEYVGASDPTPASCKTLIFETVPPQMFNAGALAYKVDPKAKCLVPLAEAPKPIEPTGTLTLSE